MTYNKKELGPVLIFILWLVGIAITCIIGISNVFALSNPNPTSVQLYDNLGSYLTAINTDVSPGNGTYTWYGNVGLTANSYGAAVGFQSNDLLVSGHMYSLTIYANADNGSSALSTKNNVGLGTSLSNAVSSYLNGSNVEISYTSTSNDYYYYIIKVNITAGYLVVPFNRTVSCSTCTVSFGGYELKDLGDSSGLTQNEVNNIINNQTTIIQNNITQVEENIKKSNEEMENTLKNEIKNTENNIKDGIKQGFESCRDSYNLFDISKFNYDQVYALFELDTSKSYTLSIKLKEGKSIPNGFYFGFTNKSYSSSDNNVNRLDILKNGIFSTFLTPNSSGFYYRSISANSIYKYVFFYPKNKDDLINNFDIMLNEGTTALDYEPYGKQVCTNRIDDTNKKLDEQNETSKGILGKIKDILSYINPFSENFFAYKLVELLLNGLKSLIVPDDFDFINDFKDVLEAKLGFIASVPIQLLDYLISFKDKAFTPVTSITFPKMTFFGYSFWNEMQIDISQGLSWISAFKYLTDFGCVVIMVNTLRKWYANFTGGDEK